METPLQKFSGYNFCTQKVKIQIQLTNQNLWGKVKGNEQSPTTPNKLLEWQSKDDKAKSIVGLGLSNFELRHVDLEQSSKEI